MVNSDMIKIILSLFIIGCLPLTGADKKPLTKSESAKVMEAAIRKELKKDTGKLTKIDLEKVANLGLIDKQLNHVPEGLEKLTQLTHLALDHNQLSNVKGLEGLTQLTRLSLFNNQLTDMKGLEKLTQLEVLVLAVNQLADVKELEKLTQLRTLWLQGNPELTKAQIDELKKALPKCNISSNPRK
jgi:Leucine-rich repeat (LRR) protein